MNVFEDCLHHDHLKVSKFNQ